MKSVLIVSLQIAVAIFGMLALAFLLFEPQIEGRNAHATQWEIYFHDSFLAYVYLASIPFFFLLYQVEKLLSQIRRQSAASPAGVATVRNIKHCAWVMMGAVLGSLLFLPQGDPEDRPQGLALRLMVMLPSIAVAVLAARFEKRLQHAVPQTGTQLVSRFPEPSPRPPQEIDPPP